MFLNIIKDDDWVLPEFWLSLFRNWLLKLQDGYNQDKERDDEGWTKEAFDGAIITYKQTIRWTRVCFALSDWSDGIINPAPGLYYDLKSQVKPRPSYPVPSGIPFTFWEQYIWLGFYLLLALAAAFAVVFLLISVLLVSPLAASVIW